MIILRVMALVGFLFGLCGPVHSETNWPKYSGVWVQLKSGDLVELPNVVNAPGRNYHAFPRSVIDGLPRINPSQIEAVIVHGINEFFNFGKLQGTVTALVSSADVPGNTSADKGEIVIADIFVPMNAYGVEYGPNHSMAGTRTFALHGRASGPPLVFDDIPVNGRRVEVKAMYIQPVSGLDGWAFVAEQ